MRIVIELDGAPTAAKTVAGETRFVEAEALPTNGGGAPDADFPSASFGSDGGGPSSDLLDSVAAAESSGGDNREPSDGTDGGAAPGTL